jgi:hypothetical protein
MIPIKEKYHGKIEFQARKLLIGPKKADEENASRKWSRM